MTSVHLGSSRSGFLLLLNIAAPGGGRDPAAPPKPRGCCTSSNNIQVVEKWLWGQGGGGEDGLETSGLPLKCMGLKFM